MGIEKTPVVATKGFGFLPYQIEYFKDKSRFKIVEKSRRIGFTYIQSFEDVIDAVRSNGGTDVWFSSADETAAKEYIIYCVKWAEALGYIAEDLGEVVLDSEKDIKALSIKFANGKRINALSSNPKQFRSKGGKVVLDEFAFHNDQDELWKGAAASALRGDKIRVISTYNGKSNRFYRMVKKAYKDPKWSKHKVTIYDAIEQGLLKSMGLEDNKDTRLAFLDECRTLAGDTETFEQEFNCNPSDTASSWIPYDLIRPTQTELAGKPELYNKGICYVGMDIGRKNDLSVVAVGEMVGDVLWLRKLVRMKNTKYSMQGKVLDGLYNEFRITTGKYDETGLGNAFVENTAERLGSHRVQGVTFTNASKHHLAIVLKNAFEECRIRIPDTDEDLSTAINAIKKTTTETGSHPRFDASRSEKGHADEFWALALMVDASIGGYQTYEYSSVNEDSDDEEFDDFKNNRNRF